MMCENQATVHGLLRTHFTVECPSVRYGRCTLYHVRAPSASANYPESLPTHHSLTLEPSHGAAAARGVHFHSTNYVASELEEPLPIDRVHKWTRERERERERETDRLVFFLPV